MTIHRHAFYHTAGDDAPFDADDEPAFDDTAVAVAMAAAAVELTGGEGHPPPDDWALAALGGFNVGPGDNDGDAPTDGLAAAAAAALLLAELTVGGLLRGLGGCSHGAWRRAPGAACFTAAYAALVADVLAPYTEVWAQEAVGSLQGLRRTSTDVTRTCARAS